MNNYKPMLTMPSNDDKNFICKEDGGYNNCIRGNPRHKYLTAYSNCVGHAGGRYNQLWNIQMGRDGVHKLALNCNAENFPERAKSLGLELSDKPSLGAIVVWRKGEAGNSSDGAGHVAIVEQMFSENEIVCSESAYGGEAFFLRTRKNSNGNWGLNPPYYFRCFIPLPKAWNMIVPVNRDETVDQIFVPDLGNSLRVRTSPDTSIKTNIVGACDNNVYYNVKSMIKVEGQSWGDTWYQIGDYWVAGVKGVEYLSGSAWVKPLPAKENRERTQIFIGNDVSLKIRFSPSTSAKHMDACDSGCFYDVLDDPISADGYLWFHIGENAYCAMVKGVDLHIQSEGSDTEELKREVAELQTKVSSLEAENKVLEEKKSILESIKKLVNE